MAFTARLLPFDEVRGTEATVDGAAREPAIALRRGGEPDFRTGERYQSSGKERERWFPLIRVAEQAAAFSARKLSVVCFLLEKDKVYVKTAFLKGELDEEVYVQTPRGIAGWPSRIKRLLKTMCRLKQGHKAWHATISGDPIQLSFSEVRVDIRVVPRNTAELATRPKMQGNGPGRG
jgi:hypothetical protein